MSDALQVVATAVVAANTAAAARQSLPAGDFLAITIVEIAAGACLGAWVKIGKADVTAAAGTASTVAAATLTSTGVFGNNETVTVGSQTYTFKTALTPAANEVLIGADQTASHLNLLNAVNLTGTPGTQYGAATTLNATVTAISSDGTHTVFNAKTPGAAGNAIVSTETVANASFGGGTFASGADGVNTSFYVPVRTPYWVRRETNASHISVIGLGGNTIASVVGLS